MLIVKGLTTFILVFFSTFSQFAFSESKPVRILTEDHRPYSYRNEGQIVGFATEIVREVMAEAKLSYSLDLFPWARALLMAQQRENSLIYPITRSADREHDFLWIGEVMPISRWYMYKLKQRQDISITKIEQAKDLSVGVNLASDKHNYLKQQEFSRIVPANDVLQLVRMLTLGRVDLILINEHVLYANMKENKLALNNIAAALLVKESKAYMAFGRNTDPEVFERTKAAYEKLFYSEQIDRERRVSLK